MQSKPQPMTCENSYHNGAKSRQKTIVTCKNIGKIDMKICLAMHSSMTHVLMPDLQYWIQANCETKTCTWWDNSSKSDL